MHYECNCITEKIPLEYRLNYLPHCQFQLHSHTSLKSPAKARVGFGCVGLVCALPWELGPKKCDTQKEATYNRSPRRGTDKLKQYPPRLQPNPSRILKR